DHFIARISLEMVTLLLTYGADFNVKNNRGETPSQLAKKRGYEAAVQLLDSKIMIKNGDGASEKILSGVTDVTPDEPKVVRRYYGYCHNFYNRDSAKSAYEEAKRIVMRVRHEDLASQKCAFEVCLWETDGTFPWQLTFTGSEYRPDSHEIAN